MTTKTFLKTKLIKLQKDFSTPAKLVCTSFSAKHSIRVKFLCPDLNESIRDQADVGLLLRASLLRTPAGEKFLFENKLTVVERRHEMLISNKTLYATLLQEEHTADNPTKTSRIVSAGWTQSNACTCQTRGKNKTSEFRGSHSPDGFTRVCLSDDVMIRTRLNRRK